MAAHKLLSPGEIADALNEKVSRVTYVLNSRKIKPVQRGGHTRLYRPAVIERVREELAIVASRPGYHTASSAA